MRGRRVAMLGFSLAFLSTLALVAVAAELGGVASLFDWFYNVTVRLGLRSVEQYSIEWGYDAVVNRGGVALVGDGFGLGYLANVTLYHHLAYIVFNTSIIENVTLRVGDLTYNATRINETVWVIQVPAEKPDYMTVVYNTSTDVNATYVFSGAYICNGTVLLRASYSAVKAPLSCKLNTTHVLVKQDSDNATIAASATAPKHLYTLSVYYHEAPADASQICPTPRGCGLRLGWGQVYYTDAMGNPASPAAGRQVLIHFPIHASPQGRYGKALVLVEVHRYDPATGMVVIDENMAIGVAYVLVGDGVEVTLLWWPKEPGTYLIRGYIWNGFPGQVEKWESYAEPLELVVNIS